jgi:hypothetical protein
MTIEKQLLIRIGGDDTGFRDTIMGALGSLAKFSLAAYVASGALSTIRDGFNAVKESILKGGDFNEAFTGFQNLADNLGRSAEAYVGVVQVVSENTKSLAESVNIAANAMKFGFSEDQFKTIATYSKKYTDAFGGNWEEMAYTIEKALATGRTLALKEFGIMAEAGKPMADVMKQIADNTNRLGEGAYNISDDLTSLTKIMESFWETFGVTANRIMGNEGFAEAFDWMRDSLMGLVDIAPKVAAGFMGLADILFGDLFRSAKVVFGVFSDLFEMLFGYPFKVREQIGIIGTDLMIFASLVVTHVKGMVLDGVSIMLSPLIALLKFANESSSWIREKMGISTEESRQQYMDLLTFTDGLNNMGRAAREEHELFAKKLKETPPLFSEIEKASVKGLTVVGEGFEKTAKSIKKAKDEAASFTILWDSAKQKAGDVASQYTLWDSGTNTIGEVSRQGPSRPGTTLWDSGTQKTGEVYLKGAPQTAGQAAGKSGGIVINVPRGDKIGEAIRDWLTAEAISEGTMRAGI